MTTRDTSSTKPRLLLGGLAYVESPRWHDGRLWFAHWGTGEIVAVDPRGASEVVGEGPPGLGWSVGWLPDGQLLVTGERLLRREPDGSLVEHADLVALAADWNELVVDGRGNVYVNGGCDFEPGEGDPPGILALVKPDGSVRQVAEAIAFPNGMAVRRTTRRSSSPSPSPAGSPHSTSPPTAACRTGGYGRRSTATRTASASTPTALSGAPRCCTACASRRAVGCWQLSSWTGARSRACSAGRTGARCSSSPPSGVAPRRWTRRSPPGPARS
jgi:hypothetical protein